MIENGRIGRFVGAARKLLLMQLAAALLAVLLALWAVFAVWELAAERDRLRAQLSEAPPAPAAAAAAMSNTATALDNEVRPPAILPILIPMPEAPPDVNMIVPELNGVAPVTNQVAPPPADPPAEQECTGANANQVRCRPGRWSRPIPQRPVPRTQPEAQPDPPSTPPKSD